MQPAPRRSARRVRRALVAASSSPQQRPLEGEPLTHPAGESSDGIVAVIQARALQRGCDSAVDVGHRIRAREERQIFRRRQLRVNR